MSVQQKNTHIFPTLHCIHIISCLKKSPFRTVAWLNVSLATEVEQWILTNDDEDAGGYDHGDDDDDDDDNIYTLPVIFFRIFYHCVLVSEC